MSALCLIDTSVFLEILNVPGKSNRHAEMLKELEEKVKLGETLLLPMSTIIETGNHIAQNGDGRERRKSGMKFVVQLISAIDGKAPFSPMNFLESDQLRTWIDGFPDFAMRGIGLGDFLIVKEWEKSKSKFTRRRVYIWSKDQHLHSYDSLHG
jgi:hypothetical protein